MTTTTRPKPRRERIRNSIKSIIRDYMIAEQWRATHPCDNNWEYSTDGLLQYSPDELKQYLRYDLQQYSTNKRLQYWLGSRIHDDSHSYGQYPATLPQTESQLLKVIQHSGYPKLRSRKTVRRCLREMVEDGELHGPRNKKFYALPLQSMPSHDFLLMENISKLVALGPIQSEP